MKKNLRIFLVCFFSSVLCTAQTYWNEWINFSQKYYKIPVSQNGIFRVDSTTLAKAGIPLSIVDPRTIQIFFRGQEQYIYIKGESDGILNSSDYIEFYGKKNDGTLDSTLYKGDLYNNPVRQPNPYYSLFNDTSAYFLTWNNSTSNKRISLALDTAFSSFSPTSYFMKENSIINGSYYYYGATSAANIYFPGYDEVEGWSGSDLYQGGKYTATFNTSNLFSAGQNAEVKLAAMGVSNDPNAAIDHILEIKYKNISGNYISLDNTAFDGYQLFDSSYSIPSTQLGTSTEIAISALTGSFSTSRNTVPYVVFKYPHNTNLENNSYYEMYVPENLSQSKSNYSFTNLNDLNTASYVYDFTNHLILPITKIGNAYKVLIPNAISSVEKFCVVKSENQFLPVSSIKAVNGTGSFTNFFSLAADSVFIIITHQSLMTGANAYKNYRSNAAGGSHHVIMADINELYDQFGYGIPKDPLSIRHFADFCLDTFPSPPQNLFLIGKSVQTNMGRNQSADPTGKNYTGSLVPSISYPTSDNMLVAGLNGSMLAPGIPIGRLPAKNNAEIITYLNKVNEYEHPPLTNPDEWMKHLIHLAGGGNASQQALFTSFLAGYEKTIKDTCFGGFVHKFSKNSSSSTQTSFTDSIKGLMNSGVSIITFFGHSGASVFEFNILPPDQYDNSNGKYPLLIADGCVAGDIHQPISNGASSSELYTLSPKGMIGCLASSGQGTAYELDRFTSALYKSLGHVLYGKSIGKSIQASMDSIDGSGNNIYINAVCLNMTLAGDPAIIIHANKLPDYAINNSSVFFTPSLISTDLDSFNVNIIINNIGKATHDSVKTTIKRIFVDGTSVSYSKTLPSIFFKDTLKFRLPVDPIKGSGLNKFEVRVDPLNSVPELDDVLNNNILNPNEVPLLIFSGDIIPVYPSKCAIVPNDTVTLKAYTANPFAASARYIFEIDTTDQFNSPEKKIQYITQAGAVVKASYNKWLPSPLILSDSTVYFWRVRRDTSDMINFHWKESSFQYIKGKRGWGQSHFFQFLKGDDFRYIDTNRTSRYFDLEKQNHSILVSTLNYSQIKQSSSIYFALDAKNEYSFSWLSAIFKPVAPSHVIVCIVNPNTGDVWHNNAGLYGSFNTGGPSGPGDEGFEFYTSTPAQQNVLMNFLLNVIPCGHKVILFVDNNHNLGDILGTGSPSINPGLVKAFQSIGGSKFSILKNDLPYILVGRKCGTALEYIADSVSATIFLGDTCALKRESGSIYSEIIGPASKWNSLHWRFLSPEAAIDSLAKKDTIKINIVGIKNNGKTDTLFKNISKDSLDIYNLNTSINATKYPYLQLLANVKDNVLRTPAQLKRWQIVYDGMPDASLNPIKHYSFYNPTVQQGDSIKMSVAIENIGDYDMDSLWVDFWVYDANRNKVPIKSMKMDSLHINKILIPDVKFATRNLPGGLSSLWVEANPFNNQHQLEQYHFNNIGTIPFTVTSDAINPLLDVTFDGVHIMNGDIISAKPLVTIQLKDENKFLALNDTGAFEIYLKKSTQSQYERLYFGATMVFYPAALPNNSCKISYTPVLADGMYEFKVQAKDRTGNFSGHTEYKITFEVINKPTITNVLNYPNPFSTSTRFVFTLTGSEVPDYFRIQILTISGKIVKEINKYELGAIHIGRNITDYAWDGKDEFGDQLANGVYLYRVLTQLDGKSLEHRESQADPFFIQGYGKMYLIR